MSTVPILTEEESYAALKALSDESRKKITVNVDSISNSDFQRILDHYNAHKPLSEIPIESLKRAEGGFQIRILGDYPMMTDPNNKIRQLRWRRRQLVSDLYIGFTIEQRTLLYNAFVNVLGKDCVSLQ